MMNRRITSLALAAACLGLGLTACGSPTHPGGGAWGRPAGATGPPAPRYGGCPQGRSLAPNVAQAVDYVDFFRLGGRFYYSVPLPVRASQLGPVIGHIRFSLTASEDPHCGPPPIVDGTAAFLPAGAPVYELQGYPPACRLAAYLNGRLQVYLARAATHGRAAFRPGPCGQPALPAPGRDAVPP